MADNSRRSFLRGAGVTAVVATATAIVPGAASAAAKGRPATTDEDAGKPDAKTGAVVAYVKDSKTGEISVMSGDREVVVTDRRLAQKIARLAD